MKIIDGGVTAAKGFKAASTAAEIKYKGRTDMAMVFSEVPCVAAGTFTTNVVKAAPVKWDQHVVYEHGEATSYDGSFIPAFSHASLSLIPCIESFMLILHSYIHIHI